jgi:hypothetical protein
LHPHVYTDAIISDLDDDGLNELILPVTYVVDERQIVGKPLPHLVITALLIYDINQKVNLKQIIQLDIIYSNEKKGIEHIQAMLSSAPQLADLDGDHRLDIIIASQSGMLYAVDMNGKRMLEMAHLLL